MRMAKRAAERAGCLKKRPLPSNQGAWHPLHPEFRAAIPVGSLLRLADRIQPADRLAAHWPLENEELVDAPVNVAHWVAIAFTRALPVPDLCTANHRPVGRFEWVAGDHFPIQVMGDFARLVIDADGDLVDFPIRSLKTIGEV